MNETDLEELDKELNAMDLALTQFLCSDDGLAALHELGQEGRDIRRSGMMRIFAAGVMKGRTQGWIKGAVDVIADRKTETTKGR